MAERSRFESEKFWEWYDAHQSLALLVGKRKGPLIQSVAMLNQAYRFLHQRADLTEPSTIWAYLNFGVGVYGLIQQYGFSGALPYIMSWRSEWVELGLDGGE